jgi:hypothetical protein
VLGDADLAYTAPVVAGEGYHLGSLAFNVLLLIEFLAVLQLNDTQSTGHMIVLDIRC